MKNISIKSLTLNIINFKKFKLQKVIENKVLTIIACTNFNPKIIDRIEKNFNYKNESRLMKRKYLNTLKQDTQK